MICPAADVKLVRGGEREKQEREEEEEEEEEEEVDLESSSCGCCSNSSYVADDNINRMMSYLFLEIFFS